MLNKYAFEKKTSLSLEKGIYQINGLCRAIKNMLRAVSWMYAVSVNDLNYKNALGWTCNVSVN